MSVLFFVTLFVSNFIFLNLFSGLLLYLYHRKRRELDQLVNTRLRKECLHFEELSQDLLKSTELVLANLEAKEKAVRQMLEGAELKTPVVQVRKIPVAKRGSVKPQEVSPERASLETSIEYLEEGEKFKEIYYLADKGMNLVDISRKTGRTKGEIELVLGLRKAVRPEVQKEKPQMANGSPDTGSKKLVLR